MQAAPDTQFPAWRFLLAALAAFLLATALVAAVALAVAARADRGSERTLKVSGQGSASVAPDHATIVATVEVRDEDAAAALQQANRRMERVVAAVRDAGVEKDELSTSNVQTHRAFDEGPRRPGDEASWVATITLAVEIDELELAGAVLGAASRAGAQQVSGPAYTVRDPAAAYEQALEQAMQEAEDKARAIAAAAGTEVGEVRAVVQHQDQGGRPFAARAETAAAADAGEVTLTPGEIEEVRARVTVTYELG